MVKNRSRRLKVYESRIGFYDTIVSAPNRAAALRAWGTHQDLFAGGEAREASDPGAVEAALARPGIPLRRGAGSAEAFGLAPNLPQLPDLPKPVGRKPKAPSRTMEDPTPPRPVAKPPDRTALSAAEAALASLEEQRRQEEEALRDRRAALAEEEKAAARRYAEDRARTCRTLERERQAYARAGGGPDRAG